VVVSCVDIAYQLPALDGTPFISGSKPNHQEKMQIVYGQNCYLSQRFPHSILNAFAESTSKATSLFITDQFNLLFS